MGNIIGLVQPLCLF